MFEGWIINAIAGAIGGNIVGPAIKKANVGWIGRSAAGIVGGSAMGYVTQYVPPEMLAQLQGMIQGQDPVLGLDLNQLAGGAASGGVGGAAALLLWARLKTMMGGGK
jgi:hypothetical protein